MKLVIDIPEEDYRYINELQSLVIARGTCKTIQREVINAIKNGTPYDEVIDEVTELLENEWGYEGMREDVAKIMIGDV